MIVENAEIRLIDGTDYDAPPSNPNTAGLIPGAGSDDTKPPYTIDMSASLEANDGSNRSLGTALAEIDANTAKTTDLSADGSTYKGDVSAATFKSTDGKTTDTGAGVLQRALDNAAAIAADTAKTAKLSEDGTTYSGKVNGDVSGATGGVTKVDAPLDLNNAPTAADFNYLIARLKTAGVFQ